MKSPQDKPVSLVVIIVYPFPGLQHKAFYKHGTCTNEKACLDLADALTDTFPSLSSIIKVLSLQRAAVSQRRIFIYRRGAGCALAGGAPAAEASPWLRTHGPACAL